MQAIEPPAVIEPAPAAAPTEYVVRRDSRTDLVSSSDTPLPLIKAGRTEDALLRQAVFVTSTFTVVRSATAPNAETLRWTYEPVLQNQLCFTSMTGQFSCTVAEVTPLPERYAGEAPSAPLPTDGSAPAPSPAAEAARAAVSESLRGRAPGLFGEERRLKIDPMPRAAGVSLRTSGATQR